MIMVDVNGDVGKKYCVRIVDASEQQSYISEQDAEMDARAVEAVKTAVSKAKFCKKPIARYDIDNKKVYIEYADGVKKYVE